MTDIGRGRIKQLKVTVEYPDGSTKEAQIDPNGLDALYLTERAIAPENLSLFNQSLDWKENPTFLEQRGEILSPRCKIDQCPEPFH